MIQYTIYKHPADHPDSWVVREWTIGAGTVTPGAHFPCGTLEDARSHVPPGLVCMPRCPDDDPAIFEVWL